MTVAVTVAAKPAAEATEQEDDEDDDKDESQRHDFISFRMTSLNIGLLGDLEVLDRHFPNDASSRRHPGSPGLLLFDGNTAFVDVDVDTGGLLPLLVELIAEDRDGDNERTDDEVENVAIHRAGDLSRFTLMQDIASQVSLSSKSIGTRFVDNQENSTVNRVPWLISPRQIRNSPLIRSTRDRTILIPSPLQAAGSNPSGKAGPSLATDSA